MKIISFIITLFVLFAGVYYLYEYTDVIHNLVYSPDKSFIAQVSPILEENNFAPLGINNELIMFKTDTLKNLNERMYDVASKIYKKSPLKLQAYYLNKPIMELDFNDSAVFEDLRTPEMKIEYDLSSFDALVYDVSVGNTAKARIEYFGTNEYFWKDYLGMCLVTIEDAPDVNTVVLEYVINDTVVSFTIPAEDVLKVYSGEMSLDDFVANVKTSDNASIGNDNDDISINKSNDNVNNENPINKQCPLSKTEAKNKADEAYAILKSYMNKGEGDLPEAQVAYADYKFFRDCNKK